MTPGELAKKMGVRADLVNREFRKTVNEIRIVALRFTKEAMTREIYAIPEDLNKRGEARKARFVARRHHPSLFRPTKNERKWTRTGNLRRSERAVTTDPFTVELTNSAAYAVPRHEAGKPGHRKINPRRVSHWRDDLLKEFGQGRLTAIFHDTLEHILKGGGPL